MIRVAAVEDELLHQNRIDAIVERYRVANHSVRPLECFAHIDEFKHYFDAMHTYDLYLLDVDIDGNPEAGIQLAKEIRKIDSYGDIVFITSHSNMMPLAFESHVKAYDFIPKDESEVVFRDKVTDALTHTLQMHGRNVCERQTPTSEIFNYHYQQRRGIQLPYDQILYIQSAEDSHRLLLMGEQGSAHLYGSLKDILSKDSDHHFMKVGRALIINPLKVDYVDRKRKVIVFFNGLEQEIPGRRVRQVGTEIQKAKHQKAIREG